MDNMMDDNNNDNNVDGETRCLNCNKEIEGKPWITVQCDPEFIVHGCSYLCSNDFRCLIGTNYWNNVVNKEDFNEPRPVYNYTNRMKKDITTGFGMEQIRNEIMDEELRMKLIEEDYENESSDYDSDEVDSQ